MLTHTSLLKIKFLVLLVLHIQHLTCIQDIIGKITPDPINGLDIPPICLSRQHKKYIQGPDNTESLSSIVKPSDDHTSSNGSSFNLERHFQIPKIEEIPTEDVRQVSIFLSTTFPLNKQEIVALDFVESIKSSQTPWDHIHGISQDVLKSIDDPILRNQFKIHVKKWEDWKNFPLQDPDSLVKELIYFLRYIHCFTHNQNTLSEDAYKFYLIIEDLVYQMICLKYQRSLISKLQVKEVLSGNEHVLANIMVSNYQRKYRKLLTFSLKNGSEQYFSSQFMHLDWQFSHYKSLVDVLEPREQRKFWWLAHQKFNKIYGGKYMSEIFKYNDFFHVLEFHHLPWYSKISSRKAFTYWKKFSEIQKNIKKFKGIFLDQDNKDLLARLHSFFDLQALERIYPGITLKGGKVKEEDYKNNMNSISFACHHFQDTENIKRFINYKAGITDSYGEFSIPSSLEKPKSLIEDGPLETEKLIKYIQITLAKADSKVSENDSAVIKSLFSDPIRNFKENTQDFVSRFLRS